MAETPKIIDLAKVVEPHLEGGRLVSYSSRYLTKPGDNYGSLMLALTAIVKRPNGEIEELPLVAKLPPITNDFYWQLFQPERTCVTENATYKYVGPAFRRLQLKAGVQEADLFDALPRFYGSRISLDPAATRVDRDAILLQENLQTSGFRAGDRHKMFDFRHAQLTLECMAKFHALAIALRLKDPQEFEEHVRPFFKRMNMNAGFSTEDKDKMFEDILNDVQFATNNNDKVLETVKKTITGYDAFMESPDAEDGIYTTISHGDMWINNFMVQYDGNGDPATLKFVDFQIAQYESLAHDVLFFLFSSVDIEVLEAHFHDFLQIYYDSFVQCLEQVGVSTEAYTYKGFVEEVLRVAPTQLPHILFMIKVISAENDTLPDDFKDVSMSVFEKNVGLPRITERIAHVLRLLEKFKLIC